MVNRDGRDGDCTHLDNENKAVVEQALKLKNQESGTVTVIAAGCDADRVLLREALAMGCDRAWLIARNSPDFSKMPMMSVNMEKLIKLTGYDVILTGYRMKSGISSFLGAELAELLSLNQITCASSLAVKDSGSPMKGSERLWITADMRCGNDLLWVESPLPCVITLANSTAENKNISVTEIFGSFEKELIVWSDDKLDSLTAGDEKTLGNFFSHAISIADLQKFEQKKSCALYDEISAEQAVSIIIENLRKQNIIKETCL